MRLRFFTDSNTGIFYGSANFGGFVWVRLTDGAISAQMARKIAAALNKLADVVEKETVK